MLPPNIVEFVNTLITKTNNHHFVWTHDDNNDTVSLDEKQFHVVLKYSFNQEIESGIYYINLTDKNNGKVLSFLTTEVEHGFQECKWLYETAQASGFNPNDFFDS